jgi:hypothetical protein
VSGQTAPEQDDTKIILDIGEKRNTFLSAWQKIFWIMATKGQIFIDMEKI